jgi:ZIP family zinc transporter
LKEDIIKTSWRRSTLLVLAITLHNIPEGLAVSVPLRREGMSRLKSFWYGQLSGIVEPIAGVIGAAAIVAAQPILPYALSFAAGAMIFVVIEEVIPEAQRGGNIHFATSGGMVGFAVMMLLDVAFG